MRDWFEKNIEAIGWGFCIFAMVVALIVYLVKEVV